MLDNRSQILIFGYTVEIDNIIKEVQDEDVSDKINELTMRIRDLLLKGN